MKKKCKLCGNMDHLRKSHIIPEFYYKPIYDEKYRFFELSTNIKHKTKFLQKGVRERLLCDNCEQKFSKYENYASKMFNSNTKAIKNGDEITAHNIDYKLFKLLQLSILWRIAISSHKIFKNIELPIPEPDLKEMLLEQNPGKYNDYGCTLTLLISNDKLLSDLIISPNLVNFNSNKYLRIIFGGFIWIFSLQKNENSFCNEYFLNERGALKMLKKYADDLSKDGKLDDCIFP